MYVVVYKVFDLCGNEHTNKMQNEWRRSVPQQNSTSSRTLSVSPYSFFRPFCTAYMCASELFIFLKCMHLLVCTSFCFPSPTIPFDCVFLQPPLLCALSLFSFTIFQSVYVMHSGNFAAYFPRHPIYRFISLVIFFLVFFALLNYQCRWSVRKVPERLKYLWQMGNKLLHKMCLFICLAMCIYEYALCIIL